MVVAFDPDASSPPVGRGYREYQFKGLTWASGAAAHNAELTSLDRRVELCGLPG